jgi:chromosome segregation ATPase
MAENVEELERQREDIEILLSTLEEAYREASITEKHYKEVKGKNVKRLREIGKKITRVKKKLEKEISKPGKKAKEEPKPQPKPTPKQEEPLPAQTPKPEAPQPPAEPETDYASIPQPLTDVAGEDDVIEVKPDKAPGAVRHGEDKIRYTAVEIKDMISKIIKEIKPEGIEISPRVDKLEVQFEKIRAYLDAMRDERSAGKENLARINQELGELRSGISTVDRKVSESEIKVHDIDATITDLKPQRLSMSLQNLDKTIKLHDARLEKTDDLSSAMLKRIGQTEEVMKKLGSLEKIVNFSRDAAKRLLEIEKREKRISRVSDKIDGIFMELNKRLDEFVLYKAKQDTLDELSQEMMKSMDDVNTRLQKFAEKTDIESLKDTFQTELASMRTEAGESPEVQRLQAQRTEIEGLIAMLDEQFKAGALPEADYNKTKEINMNRLADIERKIAVAKGSLPAPASGQPAPDQAEKKDQPEKPAETAPDHAEPEPAEKKDQPESKAQPDKKEKPEDKAQAMMGELEDSLMKGLISKKAFEKAKRLVKPKDE